MPHSNKFSGHARFKEHKKYLEDCANNPQFFIELSSICNFKCFYCNSLHSKRKGFISDEVFYHVLKQIPTVTTQPVRLHIDGEPTLHKKFFEYANALNSNGHRIALASNGSLLHVAYTNLKMDINVNLSTSAEELRQRSPMPFDKYIQTLTRYIGTWLENGSEQHLNISIYRTQQERQNIALMAKRYNFVKKFLKECGIKEKIELDIASGTLFRLKKDNGFRLHLMQSNITSGGLYPNSDSVDLSNTLPRNFGFCDSPWKRFAVLASGKIVYCCIDLFGSLSYTEPDELFTKPLKDFWIGDERIESVRENMLKGIMEHKACQVCLDRLPSRELYTRFMPQFEAPECVAEETKVTVNA